MTKREREERTERRLAEHHATLAEIDEGKLTLKDLLDRQEERRNVTSS